MRPPLGASTVSVNGALLVCPATSDATTVNVEPPADPRDGVPLTVPPDEMLAQPGRPMAENEYGLVPPEALNVAEKDWPWVAWSEDVVVMDSKGSIGNVNVPVALFPLASVTVTEKLTDPVDPNGGVPFKNPPPERFRNAGSPVAVQV